MARQDQQEPEWYGDFETFDHEPSEEERAEAVHRIAERLVTAMGPSAVIYKHYDLQANSPERWTVAVKFHT